MSKLSDKLSIVQLPALFVCVQVTAIQQKRTHLITELLLKVRELHITFNIS